MLKVKFCTVAIFLVTLLADAQSARAFQQEIADTAEKCIPAVVVIRTGRTINTWRRGPINSYDDLYNYFYGRQSAQKELVQTGQGSGFFTDDRGHILTNYHIVKDQDHFRITLHDGREFDAKLVGEDALSDLAVLKIDSEEKFPYLKFADSEKVRSGYWAIAIGAPFSLSHTVTIGIVSHSRRTVGMNPHENFIQTDASINPGNSGGPLLNIDGEVIGVNDFILTPQGGNIGLSFAITGNLAKRINDDLIKDGKVERSWIGIAMAPLSTKVKKDLNITHGIVVTELYHDSPAQRGGLEPGDIILEIDGIKTGHVNEVRLGVLSRRPGDKIKLKVRRKNQEIELNIIAGKIPK